MVKDEPAIKKTYHSSSQIVVPDSPVITFESQRLLKCLESLDPGDGDMGTGMGMEMGMGKMFLRLLQV